MSKKRTQYSSEFKAKLGWQRYVVMKPSHSERRVIMYIPRRSMTGNGNSLSKLPSYFLKIILSPIGSDTQQMTCTGSSVNWQLNAIFFSQKAQSLSLVE